MQRKRRKVPGGKKEVFSKKEKKRLIQLSLCICLFLVILFGRSNEVIDNRETGTKLLQIIQEDIDFVAAFSSLGESISRGESVLSGLEVFATELLGIREDEAEVVNLDWVYDGPASQVAMRRLSSETTHESMIRVFNDSVQYSPPQNDVAHAEDSLEIELSQQQEASEDEATQKEMSDVPIYTGPGLPENATMEYIDLGLSKTITPVLGEVSSAYGYRVHPLTGDFTFHAGVDIAADKGTQVAAFADGTVEFIGESSKYGQYIQLDHGNGIKSFYCHCSELILGKGKSVTAGQTIALAGDTGDTTGSHLHLELKKENILLNPSYYIESIN